MASLQLDPASGRYRIRFYYGNQEYKRSLHTKHRRVALSMLGQVEETLRILKLGMAEILPKVDAGDFILSRAQSRRERLPQSPVRTLADLFRIYRAELPAGAKEERTLKGERLHFKHLLRHLKPSTKIATLSANGVQRYVEQRLNDEHRGRPISLETIRKEIITFRLSWNWPCGQSYPDAPPLLNRIMYPKLDEKPSFMTMAEIHRLIKHGDFTSCSFIDPKISAKSTLPFSQLRTTRSDQRSIFVSAKAWGRGRLLLVGPRGSFLGRRLPVMLRDRRLPGWPF